MPKPKSYVEKVIAAVTALRDWRGSSRQAIATYLKREFGADNKIALRKAIKAGVASGKLSKVGARFQLAGVKIEAPDDGFRQKDIVQGEDGADEAKVGDTVVVSYRGTLPDDGKVFDKASKFEFTLGVGEVIQGWDKGVVGMRVGGKRSLICPPALAYGKRGAPPDIPPNATLHFVVKLKSIKQRS